MQSRVVGPGRYVGRIKTFNPKHGFGFVDCPAARAQWQRDVFVHKVQIGDLEVGAEISFDIKPNKDGHPQARNILMLDGRAPGPVPEDRERGGERGGDRGGGGGGERRGKGGRRRRSRNPSRHEALTDGDPGHHQDSKGKGHGGHREKGHGKNGKDKGGVGKGMDFPFGNSHGGDGDKGKGKDKGFPRN